MTVKSVEVEYRGLSSKQWVGQPPVKTFVDDLAVTTTTILGSGCILKGLEKLITWVKKNFKPLNSRFLVVKRGICGQIPLLTSQSQYSIHHIAGSQEPWKGDCNLRDCASIQEISEELEIWLSKVDKSALPGRCKAWICQHSILL